MAVSTANLRRSFLKWAKRGAGMLQVNYNITLDNWPSPSPLTCRDMNRTCHGVAKLMFSGLWVTEWLSSTRDAAHLLQERIWVQVIYNIFVTNHFLLVDFSILQSKSSVKQRGQGSITHAAIVYSWRY